MSFRNFFIVVTFFLLAQSAIASIEFNGKSSSDFFNQFESKVQNVNHEKFEPSISLLGEVDHRINPNARLIHANSRQYIKVNVHLFDDTYIMTLAVLRERSPGTHTHLNETIIKGPLQRNDISLELIAGGVKVATLTPGANLNGFDTLNITLSEEVDSLLDAKVSNDIRVVFNKRITLNMLQRHLTKEMAEEATRIGVKKYVESNLQ